MRGDDRPGARRAEPVAAGRGGKFGDRKDARPGGKPSGPRQSTDNKFEPYRPEREGRPERFSDRPAFEERGPRLGDAAFRAQREAFEAANHALKKLAMQAHGEVLTNLLTAWEKRDPEQLPAAQELGKQVAPAVRSSWVKALGAPADKDAVRSAAAPGNGRRVADARRAHQRAPHAAAAIADQAQCAHARRDLGRRRRQSAGRRV